jgi:zinc transport system ATP-binding protein
MTGTAISCVEADLGWGGRAVLRDVNLEVSAGELVMLLGASGAGKSTLLSALAGMRCVLSGSVEVAGNRSGRAGFVPQGLTGVDSPLAVEEHVALGRVTGGWRSSRTELAAARALLTQLGIGTKARDRLMELSGGQRQRAMIARALMASSSLLLCDEPTSGADMVLATEIAGVLRGLADGGCTVAVATHDHRTFTPVCDRVIGIASGAIVFDGRAQELDEYVLQTIYGATR